MLKTISDSNILLTDVGMEHVSYCIKKLLFRLVSATDLTDIMGGGAFTVIGAWLLFFYTTFVGLSPVEAASIVAIARIVDAVVSLFMGSFHRPLLQKPAR